MIVLAIVLAFTKLSGSFGASTLPVLVTPVGLSPNVVVLMSKVTPPVLVTRAVVPLPLTKSSVSPAFTSPSPPTLSLGLPS
ncbi:hypothetical protein [Moraxella oblonga]|uniref:hypothetical protein n=1 Tax=Moraxella oblonga TaxID=200413 RepID=UPI0012EE1B82|nr:hypothetical protein [Moraxella oblonga]